MHHTRGPGRGPRTWRHQEGERRVSDGRSSRDVRDTVPRSSVALNGLLWSKSVHAEVG